jgi:DNA-binding GntR family transcriptional regulator
MTPEDTGLPLELPAVRRRLLRDDAYELLLGAIVRGELPPGHVLRDRDLAAHMGLSRTPVREALARLADEGLVDTKPNAYTRVAPLDDAPAREAAVVVQALHGLATRLAVPKLTPSDIVELESANAGFAAALDDGDVPLALEADDLLHLVFVRAAANSALAAAIVRLQPVLVRHERHRFATLPGRRSMWVHDRLIAAAAADDVAEAGRLAEENWGTLVEMIDAHAQRADPTATPTAGAHRVAR